MSESAEVLREAITVRKRVGSDRTQGGLGTAWELARTLGKMGAAEEADQLLQTIIASPEVLGAANTATVRVSYAEFLGKQGRFADAEAELTAAYETYSDPKVGRLPKATETAKKMAALYDAWHTADPDGGYDAKAAEWRAKLPDEESKDDG